MAQWQLSNEWNSQTQYGQGHGAIPPPFEPTALQPFSYWAGNQPLQDQDFVRAHQYFSIQPSTPAFQYGTNRAFGTQTESPFHCQPYSQSPGVSHTNFQQFTNPVTNPYVGQQLCLGLEHPQTGYSYHYQPQRQNVTTDRPSWPSGVSEDETFGNIHMRPSFSATGSLVTDTSSYPGDGYSGAAGHFNCAEMSINVRVGVAESTWCQSISQTGVIVSLPLDLCTRRQWM